MRSNFKKFLLTLAVFVGIVSIGIAAPQAYAQDASAAVCAALGDADPTSCDGTGDAQITNVLEVALNILSVAAGIIAVISLIISGLKYITSQGDAGSISSARSSVIYAIVGIAIVVLSQVIVRFVINQATAPQSQTAPVTAPGTPVPTPGVPQ
jgi:hypothetical protein